MMIFFRPLLLPLLLLCFLALAKANSSSSGSNGNLTLDDGDEEYNKTIYFVMPDPNCTTMVLKAELLILKEWKWWINGVVTLIVGCFGLTGNLVSISVFLQKKMRNSFNQMLVALCVFDSVFIFCNVLNSGPALGFKKASFGSVGRVFDVVAQVSMCASVLMIVAFTFERHFAIRSPHQYRIHILTTARWIHLSTYIVPVTVLSFLFNIPLFMNLQRSWMANPLYVKINLWLRVFHPLTTTGLAPILILVVLNMRICKGILLLHERRTNRNAKEINMTYIAIAIVGMFVVTNLPRILLGFHEVMHTKVIISCIERQVQYVPSLLFFQIDAVAQLLMIVNSSMNFLVYSGGSSAFKEVFCQLFVPRICRTSCPGGGDGQGQNGIEEVEEDDGAAGDDKGKEVDDATQLNHANHTSASTTNHAQVTTSLIQRDGAVVVEVNPDAPKADEGH